MDKNILLRAPNRLKVKYFKNLYELYRRIWNAVSQEEKLRILVPMFMAGDMSEGRLATLLGVDRLEARRIIADIQIDEEEE